MKLSALLVLAFLVSFQTAFGACDKPWLYFDLGEDTLINTDGRFHTVEGDEELVDMHYMDDVPAYLADLQAKGYHLGLITNIPPEWGVQGLKDYIDREAKNGIPAGWRDGAPRFDWTPFEGNIIVPLSVRERKPDHPAPFQPVELTMFREAARRAASEGCEAIYQTGIPGEVEAAIAGGLHSRRVGSNGMRLLPEEKFLEFVSQ